MKRLSKMFKKEKFTAVMLVICLGFTLAIGASLTSSYAVQTTKKVTKTAKVKKPGQVKGLKKVSESIKWDGYRNVNSVKIKYKKVKGATGYQIRIYQNKEKGLMTPLLYAKNTKNTTYTIKNLIPAVTHIIKVRAYTKGKNGKIVYGKTKSIKIKTGGEKKGCYYACNACAAAMPGNGLRINEHGNAIRKVYPKELHAGGTFFWR